MVRPIDEKSVWFLFSVVVSITQFSDFWVMSYRNWKHILSVFSFHNSVSNGILVIKLTYMGPTINEKVKSHTRHTFFFFFIFLSFFLLYRLIPMAIFFFFFILFFLFFFIETPNILYQKKRKKRNGFHCHQSFHKHVYLHGHKNGFHTHKHVHPHGHKTSSSVADTFSLTAVASPKPHQNPLPLFLITLSP